MNHYKRWRESQQMYRVSDRFYDKYNECLSCGWEQDQFEIESKLAQYADQMEDRTND